MRARTRDRDESALFPPLLLLLLSLLLLLLLEEEDETLVEWEWEGKKWKEEVARPGR